MAHQRHLQHGGEPKPKHRVAVWRCFVYDEKGGLPWLYSEAVLCRVYHCLPSELDGEDARRVLRGASLLALGGIAQRFAADQTSLAPQEYEQIRDLIGKA